MNTIDVGCGPGTSKCMSNPIRIASSRCRVIRGANGIVIGLTDNGNGSVAALVNSLLLTA
jgi:hypothetical protein